MGLEVLGFFFGGILVVGVVGGWGVGRVVYCRVGFWFYLECVRVVGGRFCYSCFVVFF